MGFGGLSQYNGEAGIADIRLILKRLAVDEVMNSKSASIYLRQ
jgi:hypothetical protein